MSRMESSRVSVGLRRLSGIIMQSLLLRGSRRTVLLRAGLLIAGIAFADWRIEGNIPLGFLYLFPMLLVGSALSRWQIGIVAALCTALTEAFDSFDWVPESAIPRDILVFAAYFGMGLFVFEVVSFGFFLCFCPCSVSKLRCFRDLNHPRNLG